METKIDFLIIGAQKAGTTTLYNWLKQHPDIFLPKAKEMPFFAKNELYKLGEEYLNIFYKKSSGAKVRGGAYVNLLFFPYCAERIYNYNPNMKLLVLLRNPIDRAYSAYWYNRQFGWETLNSFDEALEAEERRTLGTFQDRANFTYLGHGLYAEQLKNYIKYFGREKILIHRTEELRKQPGEVLTRILSFLDVTSMIDIIDTTKDSNKASTPRMPQLQRFLSSYNSWYKKWGRNNIPPPIRVFIRENITKELIKLNSKTFKYPPMNPETRKKLVKFFRPHNERLEELLNTDLSLWNE